MFHQTLKKRCKGSDHMKIVFMGTPDFAVEALEAIVSAGHDVTAVVTQPDKEKGRGKAVNMPPVKEYALTLGIPVYQPEKIKTDEAFFEDLKKAAPDAIVVAAFGQILPKQILELPKYGCINIHASLLPKYRGSAPIQWAVIDGEVETGVTTMMMDIGLDTGDMLETAVVTLDEKETGGSLFGKLSKEGGKLILSTLEKLEQGSAVRVKQPEEGSTYAKMLDKSVGQIDWRKDASSIERLIRGLNPWPSAYTCFDGKTLKLWEADVLTENKSGAMPGCITETGRDYFIIQTGEGSLKIKELQLEGKKRMDTGAFLRGYTINIGTMLH